MNVLWRAIGVGSGVPNFNYTIGDEMYFTGGGSGTLASLAGALKLFHGTKKEDSKGVTIFQYKVEEDDATGLELLRNAVKKAKAVMLPGCLRCYDAVEHSNSFYFATEECVPLHSVLANESVRDTYYDDEEKFEHAVALGIHSIASSLAALHKNGMIHGAVNADHVFVLNNGGWRVFGYEMLSPSAEDYPLYKRYLSQVTAEYRRVPELSSSGSASGTAIDSWGVGCLIYETFHSASANTKASDLKGGRNIPRGFQTDFAALLNTNPKLRSTLDKLLSSSFIAEDPFVGAVLQLDELSLKDAVDRDRFYRELAQSVDTFPLRCCKYMLLPKLTTAVQYGGGSATVLEPLLKIGQRLESEEFGSLVAPAVVALFNSQDHLVRCRLLATADSYAKLLPQPLLCDKIWPAFLTGYSSKNAEMRELTVRATVNVAPLLTEKLITSDVVKYLTQMQQDPEGPIRTNATVCLGFLAPTLPEAMRAKTLLNGFGRMLKDPFHPSRVAAVRSITGALDQFTSESLAQMLLPALSPLSIDPYAEVRGCTLKCIQMIYKKLEAHHCTMDDAAKQQQQSAGESAGTSSPDGSSTSSPIPQGGSGGGSGSAKAPEQPTTGSGSGWGSWLGFNSKSSKENLPNSGSAQSLSSDQPLATETANDDSVEAKPQQSTSSSTTAGTGGTRPQTIEIKRNNSPPPPSVSRAPVKSESPSPQPVTRPGGTGSGMKLGARKKGLGAAKLE